MSSASEEVDPLLKGLDEKKQSFRRNVVSLAAELKDARRRLASQEQSLATETLIRQDVETKVEYMEIEICRLENSLEERDHQLQASSSYSEMEYVKKLEDLKLQLSAARAATDERSRYAQSTQLQCYVLVKELEEKRRMLKEQEACVNKLGEQLDLLQKDLQAREFSQKQLKDEVMRIEHEIAQSLSSVVGANTDCELCKILEKVSPKNLERLNKLLFVKDEEIAKMRDDIRVMSAHWKLTRKELESQLEEHCREDQELRRKVLKLQLCLHNVRAQTRKLQRMGEQRDTALKELREQLAAKEKTTPMLTTDIEKQNFWEMPHFKAIISMSMLILVVFSKR